jgi:HKD family nuclease
MSQLVVSAEGMQMVPVGGHAAHATLASVTALGMMGTIAWYALSATVVTTIVTQVPEVVETAVEGMEVIIGDVVTGSRLVVQCFSWGALIIAAISVVQFGLHVMFWLAARLRMRRPTAGADKHMVHFGPTAGADKHMAKYGGRLPGGGRKPSSSEGGKPSVTRGGGVTVAELFDAELLPAETRSPSREERRLVTRGQVDTTKLTPGDKMSFVYAKGSRVGQRRTVVFKKLIDRPGRLALMSCQEMDGCIRNYCPASTTEVNYDPDASLDLQHQLEDSDGTGLLKDSGSQQSDRCLTTVALLGPPKSESTVERWKTAVSGQECRRRAPQRPSWLSDPRLDEARAKVSKVVESMQKCDAWNHEMEEAWRRIQKVETAHEGMAEALGLTQSRREAAASSSALAAKWKQLSDVLETNLRHLQKVGGEVLDENLSIAEKKALPTPKRAPSTPKHGGDTDPPDPEVEEPEVLYLTGPAMLPVAMDCFENAKHSGDGMAYIIDHTGVCVAIALQAGRGVKFRLILDRANFFKSSCARQCARVLDMWKAGVQLKVLRPKNKGGFACMHVKSWIFDNQILLDGSCNMTHGGLDNNIEHLLKITTPSAVAAASASFEEYWKEAEEVTQSMIDEMVINDSKKEDKKEDNRTSRSKSASVARSVSRSLTKELEDVQPATRK